MSVFVKTPRQKISPVAKTVIFFVALLAIGGALVPSSSTPPTAAQIAHSDCWRTVRGLEAALASAGEDVKRMSTIKLIHYCQQETEKTK